MKVSVVRSSYISFFAPSVPVRLAAAPGALLKRRAVRNRYERHTIASARATLCMSMLSSTPPSTAAGDVDQLRTSLNATLSRISAAASEPSAQGVTLIAVSKTKPVALLRAAYDAGQRDFGENYVQELVAKAGELPEDVRWHFIGTLQTNKAKDLLSIPNLSSVHTVSRVKAVRAIRKYSDARAVPLDVFVQVNIDGEAQKAGCDSNVDSGDIYTVVEEIISGGDKLRFRGLMCIGDPSKDTTEGFRKMRHIRTAVAHKFTLDEADIQLSMGMSGDFENAIKEGATAVRVGSLIFGRRLYPEPGKNDK